MTNKIRIAIDMDEVIADTIDKFIELYKLRHDTVIRLDEMDGKEFNEVLPEDIKATLKSYIHEPGFFRDIKVMPGAIEVVKELCDKYDVYIVSAAMEFPNSLIDKYNWLAEHFPFISWKNIIFCATGISDSALLRGVKAQGPYAITYSVLMRAKSKTVRFIKASHNLQEKTIRLRSDNREHQI